jgi:hypothetical protein
MRRKLRSLARHKESADGTLGPLENPSPTGEAPQIAVNSAGNAVTAWRDTGGSGIDASAGP